MTRHNRPLAALAPALAAIVAVVWGLTAGLLARGQSVQAPAKPAPTFKSGVEVISVEVSVVDKSGSPIRALKPDQFDVEIDGRARRVVSADLVDHASAGDAPGGAEGDAAPREMVRPTFSSNQAGSGPPQTGRLIFLVVDQASFQPVGARSAMEAARRFIDRLQPADRVGLLTSPPPGPSVAPTRNHAAVRDRLTSIVGSALGMRVGIQKNISVAEALDIRAEDEAMTAVVASRECRGQSQGGTCLQQLKMDAQSLAMSAEAQAARSLHGLRDVVEGLARIQERKTIVLISGGLPVTQRIGGGLDTFAEIGAIAKRAASANGNIYVLHIDLSFQDAFSAESRTLLDPQFRDASMMDAGLDQLAGASGGTLMRVVSQSDVAFERVLRETAASYVLGVEPAESDRNGKSHAIKVSVKTPGAHVRSRREFSLPVGSGPAPDEDVVAATLRALRPATALAVGVSTHTVGPDTGGAARVLITAKVGSGLTQPLDVRAALLLTDVGGRVLVDAPATAHRLPIAQQDGAAVWVSAVSLQPGDYTLRLAVADAAGRVGSVDHPFSVGVGAEGGLKLGDLLLLDPAWTSPAGDVPVIPDGRLLGSQVDVHVEFVPPAGVMPDITFGVAEKADGDFLIQAKGKVGKKGTNGRTAADGRLDVSLLPPGDYVAVAVVSDGKRRLGRRVEPVHVDRGGPSPASVAGGGSEPSAMPRIRFVLGDSATLVKPFSRDDVLSADALDYFLGRLRDAEKSPPASAHAAVTALRARQFDAALAALKGEAPDDLSVAFLNGLAHLGLGALEPAAAQFRQALRAADDFLPAAFYLGACYAAGGRDDEAVGAWQTALVTETDARIVYDVLVDALLRLEHADEAAGVIEEVRTRWPDDAGFLPRFAVAEAMRQRRDKALDALLVYCESHRTDAESVALAIRLLYDARTAGRPFASAEADRALAVKYAQWYRAAGGKNVALIDRWVAFIGGK